MGSEPPALLRDKAVTRLLEEDEWSETKPMSGTSNSQFKESETGVLWTNIKVEVDKARLNSALEHIQLSLAISSIRGNTC